MERCWLLTFKFARQDYTYIYCGPVSHLEVERGRSTLLLSNFAFA